MRQFGHIIYQEIDIISDNESLALVFPISDDGSLADPIAGNYFPYTGTLTNIYHVQLSKVLSSKNHCLLGVEYKLSSILKYTYSLSTKNKYPMLGQKGYTSLCTRTKKYDNVNITNQLKNWID